MNVIPFVKQEYGRDPAPNPGKRFYLLIKRGMDVFLSLLVIVLVFPWLFPLMAVVVKLNSRGPVFFRQKRIGRHGTTFVCLKFRTMYVNNFADCRQAIKNDPRITTTGRFFRNTGLDELPQFFNVLVGDMSITGPRPHMLKDHDFFSGTVPGYACRNIVRPGITGMSQIKGFHGPADTFESILGRYQWDRYYIYNMNFWLDCSIIAKTVLVMIKSKSTQKTPEILKKDQRPLPGKLNITLTKAPDHPAQPSLSKLRY